MKCTLCYDRLQSGLTPACAQACPTESIQFGPIDELHQRADERVQQLNSRRETRDNRRMPTSTARTTRSSAG